MTSIKNNARCRRRHKQRKGKEEGEDVELENEDHLQPSCSQLPPNVEPTEEPEIPTRISFSSTSSPMCDQVSEPLMLEKHRLKMAKTRRRQLMTPPPIFTSIPLVLIFLCAAFLVQPCSAITELRCGPVDIRNTPMGFRSMTSHVGDPNAVDANSTAQTNDGQVNCTVIEGSFVISFLYLKKSERISRGDFTNSDFPRFPYLREITGSLLVFETSGLTSLKHIMPNLRVIGGGALIQHYSIVIYRNHDLEFIGLNNLRKIRNGGVRIMENERLCHTTSIDWKKMIMSSVNDVYVDNAGEGSLTETGKMCQAGACVSDPDEELCNYYTENDQKFQSCWDDTHCMKKCQYDFNETEHSSGCDPFGNKCHKECLGGCDRPDDATACHACKNVHYKGKCIPECAPHLYKLMNRRCVTKSQCLALNPVQNLVPVTVRAANGLCSDKCPENWEPDPDDAHACRKCVGECLVHCPGNFTIDTYAKAQALRHCNVIDGSLVVAIRGDQDSGMVKQLPMFLQGISIIKGYLQIMRSPPLLSLHLFRGLRRIEGEDLLDRYALSVIDNGNMRKLFPPEQNVSIARGMVQIQNNRVLCFREIKEMMKRLGKVDEMDEEDQSPKSNGDKAICEDTRIDIRVVAYSHDHFNVEWVPFNTSDIDHRKFLGYEIYYKAVPAPDPTMSIDEDRSACVDSWNSVFLSSKAAAASQEKNKNSSDPYTVSQLFYTDQGIQPHTTYAVYVATQMVNHDGAKNGVSKIAFVTTFYYRPEPPVVSVKEVNEDNIVLEWEPPTRPHGIITHYLVSWREVQMDVEAYAKRFCKDETSQAHNTKSANFAQFDNLIDEEPEDPESSPATTLLSLMKPEEGTCAARGCCDCGTSATPTIADAELIDDNARASVRSRRAIENANRVSEMIDKKGAPNVVNSTVIIPANSTINGTDAHNKKEPPEGYMVGGEVTVNITKPTESGKWAYTIRNLKHYTSYSVSVVACQNLALSPAYCSHVFKAAKKKRTRMVKGLDRVDNSTIVTKLTNGTNNVKVTWKAPTKFNGGIVGYLIKITGSDDRTPTQACVGAVAGFSPEKQGVTFKGLADGAYRVEITTHSMNDAGEVAIRDELFHVFTPGFFTMEVIAILVGCTLTLLAIVALVVYYFIRQFYGKKVKEMADFMQKNPEYCNEQSYLLDDWELPKCSVHLSEQLGEGSFGKVFLAHGDNLTTKAGDVFGPCAVKINLEDMTNSESLNYLMEASIMKNFETNFIVKLYGVISAEVPAWVVMELMEKGNLRDYLRSKRDDEVFNEMDCEYYGVIPRQTYVEWAAQISDGMAYLESLKFVHRDLAARNCMIDAHERVKIGDFGMARDLFYHEYYKPSGKRMMPVRWMSPESLKDGKFDSKSDMWSFGIVLYEMMTLGAQPYIGLSNDEVLNYIGMARKTIKKPECCSDYWYKIMQMCWRFNPHERPTFLQLVHLFTPQVTQEFKDLSYVLNDNQVPTEDFDFLDMGGTEDVEVLPAEDRRGENIPMREIRPAVSSSVSPAAKSPVTDGPSTSNGALLNGGPRQRSVEDEYALMNHSRGPSDAEVRNFTPAASSSADGDYVERDVTMDVPTRRNTGASSSSYGNGPYCLANRGGSTASQNAGFMESVRLTDGIGSGGHLDEGDYVEKDLSSSMDTRRSTGASTSSYGNCQPTWTANKGATFYAEKEKERPKTGGGDRLTHLPGTTHLQNRGGDYVETEAKNGSPSRNGNGPYCGSARNSFNGRHKFGEDDRLLEDNEHPLN